MRSASRPLFWYTGPYARTHLPRAKASRLALHALRHFPSDFPRRIVPLVNACFSWLLKVFAVFFPKDKQSSCREHLIKPVKLEPVLQYAEGNINFQTVIQISTIAFQDNFDCRHSLARIPWLVLFEKLVPGGGYKLCVGVCHHYYCSLLMYLISKPAHALSMTAIAVWLTS